MPWALALLILILLGFSPARALDVRTVPSDTLYVYAVNEGRGIYDAVIHSFAVVNDQLDAVSLEEIRIEARKDGTLVQSWWVPPTSLLPTTKTVADFKGRDELEQLEVYFHAIELAGDTATPASSPILVAGTYLLGLSRHLVFPVMPNEIKITAAGKTLSGDMVTAEKVLTVEHYQLKNDYHLPVAGRAYVSASAEPDTNHRWSLAAEFAVDFDALGGDSSRFKTDRSFAEDFYIFGRDVLASADGTVVEVISDQPDTGEYLKAPDEDIEDAIKRVTGLNREGARRTPRALCGNRVVIDHGQGEFSLSCHLKQDSVRVAVGDAVRQGQVTGQVGNSGNAGTAHLHFQISDGPDQFTSRSLPVTFSNIRETWGGDAGGKYLLGGQIVEAKQD